MGWWSRLFGQQNEAMTEARPSSQQNQPLSRNDQMKAMAPAINGLADQFRNLTAAQYEDPFTLGYVYGMILAGCNAARILDGKQVMALIVATFASIYPNEKLGVAQFARCNELQQQTPRNTDWEQGRQLGEKEGKRVVTRNINNEDERAPFGLKMRFVRKKAEEWKKGQVNPVAVNPRPSDSGITFECNDCGGTTHVRRENIYQPHRGVLWNCSWCNSVFYVPPEYCQNGVANSSIPATMLVPIREFGNWYFAHPVYASLGKNTEVLNGDGLWCFCAECHHRFASGVLTSFALYQQMARSGALEIAAGFIFAAQSAHSAEEMKALQAGGCPECGCESLLCLLSDLPPAVRQVIQANSA
jgi:hypothetical protein